MEPVSASPTGRIKFAACAAALAGALVIWAAPSTARAEMVVNDVAYFDCDDCVNGLELRANGHFLLTAQSPEDSLGTRVYDLAPDGTLTAVAGCGCTNGMDADGIAATSALLFPGDIEPTADGGFVVQDRGAIRKISSGGTITTLETSPDLGGAVKAFATASDGDLLVDAFTPAPAIFKVDSLGEATQIAGNGTSDHTGDGGPAIDAGLITPYDIDSTGDGSVLLVEGYAERGCRIREIGSDGDINTVAGKDVTNPPGPKEPHGNCGPIQGPIGDRWWVDTDVDGSPALDAGLATPYDVAADPTGGFATITNRGQHVLHVGTDGNINVAAGNGFQGFGGNGCPAQDVSLYYPLAVTVAPDGTIYYVDSSALPTEPEGHLRAVLRSISEGTVTDCDLIGVNGTPGGDDVDGGPYAEKVLAADGNDTVDAGGGKDKILGEEGNDTLDAGAGKDSVNGGAGKDNIDIAGRGTDSANCGPGRDVVNESGADKVSSNCEVVK
jgi:hypothetical protein